MAPERATPTQADSDSPAEAELIPLAVMGLPVPVLVSRPVRHGGGPSNAVANSLRLRVAFGAAYLTPSPSRRSTASGSVSVCQCSASDTSTAAVPVQPQRSNNTAVLPLAVQHSLPLVVVP